MKAILMLSAIAILATLPFGHSIYVPGFMQPNMPAPHQQAMKPNMAAPHHQGMKHQHGGVDCDEDHPAHPHPPHGLKQSMHIPPYQFPHSQVHSHPELPPPHTTKKPGQLPSINITIVEPSNDTSTEPIEVYIPPLPTDSTVDNSSDHSITKRHIGGNIGSMDLRMNSTDKQEPCKNDTVLMINERFQRSSGADPKAKFSKVIGLVEIFKLQDCVARVICDLNCNPDAYGDDGKKVLNMALQLQTGGAVSETDVRAYVNAGLTGRKFRQAATCEMCLPTFSNCSASTPDLIDVFSLIKLDV